MKEDFLHYIWFNKLFDIEQQTTDGQRVEIVDTGTQNRDSGPDVFNAKVKIGDTLWAGNIEFHVSTKDWRQHKHSNNKSYDSVVLNVVLQNEDTKAIRTNKTTIPQMVISYPKRLEEQFQALSLPFVDCAKKLIERKNNNLEPVFQTLLQERLNNKFVAIERLLLQLTNDWEEAFYITTARSFGFGTNADAFELLAKNIPQKTYSKLGKNPISIEALLFGVAGFLSENMGDEYFASLKKEYNYLKHKFLLKEIDRTLWKFLRLRPSNFPTIRIAQFASLIMRSSKLFSKILEQRNYKEMQKYFDCEPSEYWQKHYVFNKESKKTGQTLSKQSIDILIVNCVVPFIYAYGKKTSRKPMQQRATSMLKEIASEKNNITKGFALLGIEATNAFESQALIELKSNYCNAKKCYMCKNKFKLTD